MRRRRHWTIATSSASFVIRSTAARSSSSLIRVNTPSTTMSLTVSEAGRLDAAERGDREERGGLHLDREHAARRPALVLALVRVVEEVARDDRPDVELPAAVLGDVHRLVQERPGGGRAVRLVVRRGASRSSRPARRSAPRSGRRARGSVWSPPQVPTRISFLQPSWISSSNTIVAPGQPIPVPCTETGLPFQVPV